MFFKIKFPLSSEIAEREVFLTEIVTQGTGWPSDDITFPIIFPLYSSFAKQTEK